MHPNTKIDFRRKTEKFFKLVVVSAVTYCLKIIEEIILIFYGDNLRYAKGTYYTG